MLAIVLVDQRALALVEVVDVEVVDVADVGELVAAEGAWVVDEVSGVVLVVVVRSSVPGGRVGSGGGVGPVASDSSMVVVGAA